MCLLETERKNGRVKFDDSFVGELFMRGIFLCDIILYAAVSLQILLLFCLFQVESISSFLSQTIHSFIPLFVSLFKNITEFLLLSELFPRFRNRLLQFFQLFAISNLPIISIPQTISLAIPVAPFWAAVYKRIVPFCLSYSRTISMKSFTH